MLRELLDVEENHERLTEWEVEAFANMRMQMQLAPVTKWHNELTEKQRAIVVARYETFGLGAQASVNLWSDGKVPVGIAPKEPRQIDSMPRPVRPPRRR